MKTRITEMLGIKYPVLQGGMQRLARAELAAAVSEAGALGIIAAGTFETKEQLREEVRKAKKMTGNPFGVNISLFPAIMPPDIEGYIDVLVDEGIGIVETAGRSPEEYMDRFKKNKIKVAHKVTTIKHALKAQSVGCDAVIIDGCECAGHPGEELLTSLVLIPLAADALSVPLVAAGGFGDGRGLAAALALGADAVLMGTRFMVTKEAPLHPAIKEHLVKASETDTTLILRSFKNTARVLKNKVAAEVAELESQGAEIDQILPIIAGRKGLELIEEGNIDAGILACGQVVGLIKDIPAVKELVERIAAEAASVIGIG